MVTIASVVALLTGVLCAWGGIQGFRKAKSRPSLIAGIVLSDFLTIGAALALFDFTFGLWISAAGAAALLGRFVPVYAKDTSKVWPALVMALSGAVTLSLCLAALLG